ncbi:MAG: rane protein-like protein [Actinomycetia bacterium]|nr:rane protein-like protein [Actinomycetes bacterium]
MEPVPPTHDWARYEVALVVGLTAMVVLVSSWRLSSPSFWNDEAATWAVSGHGLSDLLQVLRDSGGDRGAALYYGIVHVWIGWFGTSEIALRSLSVLAAAGTIAPFHAVARRLVSRSAAVVATVLLAASPFFLAYARSARAYEMALAFVVLASWAFLRAVEQPTRGRWVLFVGLAAVSVYLHWFAALVILAQFASLLPVAGDAVLWTRVRRSALALTLLVAPIAMWALFGSNSGIDWVARLNLAELRSVASTFVGTNRLPLELAVLCVFAVGLVTAVRAFEATSRSATRTVPALELTWFPLPLLVTVAVSMVKPVLVSRYLIVALPGYVLLVGIGLVRLTRHRRKLLAAGLVLVVALTASGYRAIWFSDGGVENWRGVVALIGRQAGPDDAIVIFPASAEFPFSYYARSDAALAPRAGPLWPPVVWSAAFNRNTANSTALPAVERSPSPVLWLVIREPHGPTINSDAVGRSELELLQQELDVRYGVHQPVSPFADDLSLMVVRYSIPISP